MSILNRLFLIVLFIFLSSPSSARVGEEGVGNANGEGISLPVKAASVAGCAQATTFLARTSGANSAAITAMICNLVTQGVITGNLSTTGCGPTPNSLDRFFFFATDSSSDAIIDICGNANATLNGATFIASQGLVTAAGTGIDTGFNPATATSPNFTQNNASFSLWTNGTTVEALAQMANIGVGNVYGTAIYDSFVGSISAMRVNENASAAFAQPGTKGLFAADRSGASVETEYWDGTVVSNPNTASIAVQNGDFFIGKITDPSSGPSVQSFAAFTVGGHFTATQQLALYTQICAALTAIRGSC